MAGAMIRGLIASGAVEPGQIGVRAGDDGTAEALAADTGVVACDSPAALLDGADVLVLACKPYQLEQLEPGYREALSGALLLSILAGTPHERLRAALPGARAWIWAMPNTPAQIGAGTMAWSVESPLSAEDGQRVELLLGSLGKVAQVEPAQMHAATGLSGSGPAYVFAFVEALAKAGEAEGLPAETALRLALSTASGSIRLMEKSGKAPAELITEVVTPGGTTEAGLKALNPGLDSALRDCVAAATQRSREIASGG